MVLHDLSVTGVSSTFPISLGARITGVDDQTFSSTGEAYSMIVLPEMSSSNERVLQQDDVSLAYSFAQKFPGCKYPSQHTLHCIRTLLLQQTPLKRQTLRTTSLRRASTRNEKQRTSIYAVC